MIYTPHAPCAMPFALSLLPFAPCRYPISCIRIIIIYRLLCFSLYKEIASCYDPPDRHLKYSAEIIDRRRTHRHRHCDHSGLRSRCYDRGVGWTEQPGVTPFAGIQQFMKLHETKHRTSTPPIDWVLHPMSVSSVERSGVQCRRENR